MLNLPIAGHSTETALLRVHHDIVSALDENSCVALVMLDLSAAFDVIDHDILIGRMEHSYGISGSALAWFRSYLSGRTQQVKQFPAFFSYGLEFPSDLCWNHVFTACFQNLLLKYVDAVTCDITAMLTTRRSIWS
jgi:hypothetical protein